MNIANLNTLDLLTLSDVLKLLPGVQSRNARERLWNLLDGIWLFQPPAFRALYQGKDQYSESFTLGGSTVTFDQAAKAFIRDNGTTYASPAGAALLVRFYLAGALPMTRKRPAPIPDALQAYIDSEDDLLLKADDRAIALQAKAQAKLEADQAYETKLGDLAAIAEGEFTWGLLNDIFWRHRGQTVLAIGGIAVTRWALRYSSNSGKSGDWGVTISWTGSDGALRTLEKPSAYQVNRRNDSERNWGLPG